MFSALCSQRAQVNPPLILVPQQRFQSSDFLVATTVVVVIVVVIITKVILIVAAIADAAAMGNPNIAAVLHSRIVVCGRSNTPGVGMVTSTGDIFNDVSGNIVADHQMQKDATGGRTIPNQLDELGISLNAVASQIGPRTGPFLARTHRWAHGFLSVPPVGRKSHVLAAQGLPERPGLEGMRKRGVFRELVVKGGARRKHLFKGGGSGRYKRTAAEFLVWTIH
mmetsp:Transcript_17924/g.36942  ORF Transcript_17924/g.36942 Transcript_17924/m.36942 type:complete len:223 (-) Transcript_17924:451-1119(-)